MSISVIKRKDKIMRHQFQISHTKSNNFLNSIPMDKLQSKLSNVSTKTKVLASATLIALMSLMNS
jgi:hypothetical protein